MRQYVIDFTSYADGIRYFFPNSADVFLKPLQPEQLEDILLKDLDRFPIFLPEGTEEQQNCYLWNCRDQFMRQHNYTQGDYSAGFLPRTAISFADLGKVLLPGAPDAQQNMQDFLLYAKDNLLELEASYINDQGQLEGFTLCINKLDPRYYAVSHFINIAGQREDVADTTKQLQAKFYYSPACPRVEDDKKRRAQLVDNEQSTFPYCVGNEQLRQRLVDALRGDAFDIHGLRLIENHIQVRQLSALPAAGEAVAGKAADESVTFCRRWGSQAVISFKDYATLIAFNSPESVEYFTFENKQTEKNRDQLQKDINRLPIYVPEVESDRYLSQYQHSFFQIFDFAQGDESGHGMMEFWEGAKDFYAILFDLPGNFGELDGATSYDLKNNQLLNIRVSYLADDGTIEGFTLYLNKKDPRRYIVGHFKNVGGYRVKDEAPKGGSLLTAKIYCSAACDQFVSDHGLEKVGDDQRTAFFPYNIGNQLLREEMINALVGQGESFNVKELEKIDSKLQIDPFSSLDRQSSAATKPLQEPTGDDLEILMRDQVVQQYDSFLNHMKDAHDAGRKDDQSLARQKLAGKICQALVGAHDNEEELTNPHCFTVLNPYAISAGTVSHCRQLLANTMIKLSTTTVPFRKVYSEYFDDLTFGDMPQLASSLAIKGSIFIGVPTLFGRVNIRKPENSFEGHLQQLAKALYEYTKKYEAEVTVPGPGCAASAAT